MLWVAFLVCFLGFLRSGEITILDASSYDPSVNLNYYIAADNPHFPSIIQIRIKACKNDPFCQGADVHIGKTNNALCPIITQLNYLSV